MLHWLQKDAFGVSDVRVGGSGLEPAPPAHPLVRHPAAPRSPGVRVALLRRPRLLPQGGRPQLPDGGHPPRLPQEPLLQEPEDRPGPRQGELVRPRRDPRLYEGGREDPQGEDRLRPQERRPRQASPLGKIRGGDCACIFFFLIDSRAKSDL